MHDSKRLLARGRAVGNRARKLGREFEADDLAQEAILKLIENPQRKTQTTHQAFVDAVRSIGQESYSRTGAFNQPIFESAFEDYANFIDGIGSGLDLESQQIVRSELLDVIRCSQTLKPINQEVLKLYVEGLTMVEISKLLGCTESRICQLIKFSRIKLKAEIVSQSISRQKQRQRKWRESQGISHEIQTRSGVPKIFSFEMAAFPIKAIEGLVSFTIPKIPQTLFTSF